MFQTKGKSLNRFFVAVEDSRVGIQTFKDILANQLPYFILEPIALSSLAADLPLLPFLALRDLFKSAALESEYGQSLRKDTFGKDIIKLLLSHLGSLCYQEAAKKDPNRKMYVSIVE